MSNKLTREVKIVVLGGGGVGKSSLTIKLCHGDFSSQYDPTIEDSYNKTLTVQGEPTNLYVIDTAGQEEYSAMRETYMKEGNCFLVVYSVTDKNSFDEITKFYDQLKRNLEDVIDIPLVLVANKCDVPELMRQVSTDEGTVLAMEMGCKYFEASAKEGINVEKVFESLAELKYPAVVEEQAKNKDKKRRKKPCVIS